MALIQRVRQLARGAALAALLGACGTDEARPTDSARAPAPSASAAASVPGAPACPRTGHWSECHVRERITRAGFAPRDTAELEDLPALTVKPLLFRIGRSGLAVYLFPDSAARGRAARALDTVRFVPAALPLSMRSRATLIENDNLLALLFSKNEHQRERVSDAFMAGAPQPSTTSP